MQKAINQFSQRAKEFQERINLYNELPNNVGANAATLTGEIVDLYNRLSDIFYPIQEVVEVLVDNDYEYLDKQLIQLHEKMINTLEVLVKNKHIDQQLLLIHTVGATGNFIPKNLLPNYANK